MTGVLPRRPVARLTIQAALLLGASLTLGIWLLAGYHFSRRVADTERHAAAINARYMQSQALLSTIRAQVLLGSVYVRDALLDPASATLAHQQLEGTYLTAQQALQQYVPMLETETERDRVSRLQREVEDFQRAMLQVLTIDPATRTANAKAILQTQVVPKREAVIRISEETQALNRSTFVDQQLALRDIYAASQRRLWLTLGLALVASSGVALLAALYAGRLENRLQQQGVQDAQTAVEMQRLSARLFTAQEDERRSIARELHDQVGQVLTAIKVELAMAERAIEGAGGSPAVLSEARVITDGALTTVRDLSHLLHPAMLDDLGLPAAIEWYLRGFSRRHDIRTEFLRDDFGGRLSPEIEAPVYRIVQEALTNVAKHARATVCRVYLQRLQHTVLVTIEDDGVGFDQIEVQRAGAAAGLGLISIRERAAQLSGTVRLETRPGKGTRLTVEIPTRAWIPDNDSPVDTDSGITIATQHV